eukprot:TRINITY_DN16008_c0_g1_i2.p1 TRINITY_DN16008_c0_g1~~TRINITY_DN16008_c0_g1_i2.p1  ORF type:complete len:298 (+),score=92.24 TRINITY_DN16008_c0_g1_i2:65-958(+)
MCIRDRYQRRVRGTVTSDDMLLWLAPAAVALYLATVAAQWTRVVVMDLRHNRGKFMLSSWNGLGNLLTLFRNMDRLYDFIGDMYLEWAIAYLGKDSQEELLEDSIDFLPNAIVKLPLFRITSVVNPRDIEHILKTNFDNYPKGPMVSHAMKDLLGEGIFAVDGHMWRKQRKTASHEFTVSKFHEHYIEVFTHHAESVLSVIESHQGKPIEMQELFQRYTLESIAELGFGVKLGCLDSDEPLAFAVAFDQAQAQLWRRTVIDQMTWKLTKFLGIGNEGRMAGWTTTLREFTQDVSDKG